MSRSEARWIGVGIWRARRGPRTEVHVGAERYGCVCLAELLLGDVCRDATAEEMASLAELFPW